MSDLALDHVVIYVQDLASAIEDYRHQGFTVTPGGEHSHTHNALIIFRDQSYIELLALKPGIKRSLLRLAARVGALDFIASRKTDMSWRLLRWAAQPYGALDWCLRSGNIQAVLARVATGGQPVIDAQAFERSRPDGKIVRWWLGCTKNRDLPFLLQDQTDINLRIPLVENIEHANGATGIKQLFIAVDEPMRATASLAFMMASPYDKGADQCDQLTVGTTHIQYCQAGEATEKISLQLAYAHD